MHGELFKQLLLDGKEYMQELWWSVSDVRDLGTFRIVGRQSIQGHELRESPLYPQLEAYVAASLG